MKKHISKLIAVFALIAAMVSMLTMGASAEVTSSLLESPTCTAGKYADTEAGSITSTLGSVYGGDMGIWFYTPTTGLQSSFKRDLSRTAYMSCYESDGSENNDCLARKYEARFKIVDDMYYPASFKITYTSTALMEGHSTIEPFMRFKIATVSGDTSKAVPKGILRYQYWVY